MLKYTPDYIGKKQRTLGDFKHLIADLRSEDGCPWDREQTNASLKKCMLEEAAEAVSAISLLEQTGNPDNLKEEVGDVLLQVVMQSQIAEEQGYFTLEDVIEDVCRKMISRHPHVFGDASDETVKITASGQVLEKWEEIKEKEKADRTWEESPRKKKFRKRVVKWFVKRL